MHTILQGLHSKILFQKAKSGSGEMTQQLEVLAAPPDNLSLVPSTHIEQLTTACNFRESDALFCVQEHQHRCDMHTRSIKKNE